MARNRTPTAPLLAYAMPGLLSALVHGPAASIVPTIYASDFGLSLAAVGLALLISRSCDVVVDPLIGYLSDHTRGPLGRRKPWIVAGGVLTAVSAWFLFAPPAHPGFVYFLAWYTLIYLAWSLIEVPHTAWAYELTRDYADRSRVLSVRAFVQGIGAMAFLLLPLLPIFPTTAVTPQVLRFTAWLVLALAPVLIGVAVIWAPSVDGPARAESYRLGDLVSVVRGNRPFWFFLAAFVLNGFSGGMFGALAFLYFTDYLGLAAQYAALMLALAVVTMTSLWAAPAIINRIGKRAAWAGSMLMDVAVLPLMLLIPPGPGALAPLLCIAVPIGLSNAVANVSALAVLGDVIDYDTWRTGSRRAAVYSGLLSFVIKVNAIPGGAVALMIAGLMGYVPKLGPHNTPHAVLGLKIAYVIAPSILYAASAIFAWLFPIDRRRQRLIGRRLEAREARLLAAETTAVSATLLG